MPSSPSPLYFAAILLGSSLIPLLPSCRKTPEAAATAPSRPVPPALLINNLPKNTSTILADQAEAPVHWQPWNKETLANAKIANRLIFAVIALPQQSESPKILESIYGDAGLVSDINSHFVPILVDGDTYRETTLLAESLCREIKYPFSLPLFVWLTPDGNPIAWIPAQAKKSEVRDLFTQSSAMVSRMWQDNPNYILSNSSNDNTARAKRLSDSAICQTPLSNPSSASFQGIRRLASLYDPGLRTFDSQSGLFPSGALAVLCASAISQDPALDGAKTLHEAAEGLAHNLSTSAMIDPLDGGIFNARQGKSWQLPRFSRDCSNHARTIIALVNAYQLNHESIFLEQILKSIDYAEIHYATSDGLFALGRPGTDSLDRWFWTLDELKKSLTPEELKIWVAVSDIRAIGNLPIESDPAREHLHKNTLSTQLSPEKAALSLGVVPEIARAQFESGRQKLLKIRESRPTHTQKDPRPHAIASFRMASAYAAAYTATGDPALKQKASATWEKAKKAFSLGPTLVNFPNSNDPMDEGRAFLYGIALESSLDVFDITMDPAVRSWAKDLAGQAAERFMDGATLRENTPTQSIVNVILSNRFMISDESSAGLLSAAEARLVKLGFQAPPAFSSAVTPITEDITERPLIHSDALFASLIRLAGPSISLSDTASEDLKTAVSRLTLRLVTRHIASTTESIPAGSAKILFANGSAVSVNTPAELESVIFAGDRQQ